ncbi:MAG TPA: hypothetical protein VFB81_17845, partial [Myxococcales bacterium]|nr:hypothetical protein [Myxococcales bacterium]
ARLERVVDLASVRERPGQDSTLRPREERTVELSAPVPAGAGARLARLTVRFRSWPPEDEIARAAGLSRDQLVHPLYTREFPLPAPEVTAP